jgi:hypothetical protein
MSEVIRVGDRMRISVALIRQIDAEIDGQSPVVEVAEVRLEHDGTKTLVMKRIDTEDPRSRRAGG